METENITYGYFSSPIGRIEIGGTLKAITSLEFIDQPRHDHDPGPVIEKAADQLEAYFQGRRQEFDLPLELHGTPFQNEVWRFLATIPYGRVVSYGDLAQAIGRPSAIRAVGAANGRNPIPIILPCHRVIGSNGDLTGYGGGLWRKEWLLKHEGYLLL